MKVSRCFSVLIAGFLTSGAVYAALNAPHTEPLPPKWAFGYQQSSWDENMPLGYDNQAGLVDHGKALRGLDNQFGKHLHPCDVIVQDIYWCNKNFGSYPANMTWYAPNYPNPKAMFDSLHAMHYKVMMCYHSGGYGRAWIDSVKRDLRNGLDIIWLDFWGQHNYEQEVHDTLQNIKGGNNRVLMLLRHYARPNSESGEAGTPDDPASEKKIVYHWTGDMNGNWLAFQQAIEGTIYGNDGAPGGWSYLNVDCPGHWNTPAEIGLELSSRWIQWTDFTTFSRNHGHYGRDVWSFGAQGEVNSNFSRSLRYRLLPYIYTYCWQTWENAMPLTRSMAIAYPGENNTLKYQYMFGDWFLVAPAYQSRMTAMNVYLPRGNGDRWIDYWTQTEYAGNQTIQVDATKNNYMYIPLFVRKGAIIPMGPQLYWIDPARPLDTMTLDVYPKSYSQDTGKSSFTLYEDDGTTLAYQSGSHGLTPITCARDANDYVTLTIGAMTGTYTGKPASRTVIAKINLHSKKPLSVTDNGAALMSIANYGDLLGAGVSTGWAYDSVKHIVYAKIQSSTSAPSVIVTSSNPPSRIMWPGYEAVPGSGANCVSRVFKTAGSQFRLNSLLVGRAEYALVYDAQGRLLSRIDLKGRGSVDLSGLKAAQGVFFLRIVAANR